MKRLLAAVALMVSSGACTHVNRATLATSTAALAVDWYLTRAFASRDWRCESGDGWAREKNPIISGRPSATTVDIYFAAVAVGNLALWLALDKRYKSIAPLAVTALQVHPIVNNIETQSTHWWASCM